jgi:polyhydroxyalkanoate synthesis regulator phasin
MDLSGNTATVGNGAFYMSNTGGLICEYTLFMENSPSTTSFRIRNNGTGSLTVYDQNGTGVYLTSGQTSWTGTSDVRLKKNIELINTNDTYNKLLQLKPVRYHLLGDDENSVLLRSGLIAQDVLPLFPEIVSKNGEYYGITYTEFIPHIIASIQKQDVNIKNVYENVTTKIELLNNVEITSFRNELNNITNTHINVLTTQNSILINDVETLKSQVTSLTSQLDFVKGQVTSLTSQIDLVKVQVKNEVETLKNNEITSLTSQVDTLTTQVASLMSSMARLKQMFNL